MNNTFYSNGKLLLTGEYVVLDGATALAIPTKYGQRLTIEPTTKGELLWNSFDFKSQCWFSAAFTGDTLEVEGTDKPAIANTLQKILREAKHLNPNFLNNTEGVHVTTELDFPQNWGLGSSSTLINNIAQWAQVDAFTLLQNSFGGSGYDIAAAQQQRPFFYQLNEGQPSAKKAHLAWDFKDHLFFVHLNQKQDSKEGIVHYRNAKVSHNDIEKISDLGKKLLLCYTLRDFENVMQSHEKTISEIIKIKPIKERIFPDFKGTIKSLGAWGGDFVLATGNEVNQEYFRRKGYPTIIPFTDMLL
ncbi:GYDIA family GHMP kinase [Marixanthomonas ophiurae]|uniref:GHMP kinase n=1 Tax=Marixanthomonas ophiurae TaxID=387659 RepID=A0A3E1Q9H9_9FLAO|nr:GYDIA family GHMP kinase [Marixanthomonas ophiurae]RFN58783.1 GHMP kinase [Marixanthomonas ophiurae]